MRLIDRDLLLSEIEKSRGKNPHKDYKIRANHTIEHDHIAHLVLEQPVAYDVDKVVEGLRLELGLADKEKERCAKENPLQFDEAKGYARGVAVALEVVKSGSIE